MINGMQHIGIGVRNREESYKFYNNALLLSVPISKHEGHCTGVLPLIKTNETRNVIIAMNPYGGAAVEVFQYTSRTPSPVPKHVDFTYNGYLFYGLAVKNIQKQLDKVKKNNGNIITGTTDFTPMKDRGWKTAVFTDPFGITGILVDKGESKNKGIDYVAVGVSNLEQSLTFYNTFLGYDVEIYKYEGECPEWDGILGKGRKIKRVLLERSKKPQGPYKHFLKGGMIELIEVEGNSGKRNFEGRQWGDIGFMELCFDVSDIRGTVKDLTEKGVTIAVPPYTQKMGKKTEATFAYIKDPDGSLLEFAELNRLPVPYPVIRTFVNPFMVKFLKSLKVL
jgi:catechol 2,3-dioxygenase-like lactoylglutathione lyase family enzyme